MADDPEGTQGGGGKETPPSGGDDSTKAKDQEIQRLVNERKDWKSKAQAANQRLAELAEANAGTDLTAEDIKELRAAREAKATAEREAAEKKGEYDKLRADDQAAHKKALQKAHSDRDRVVGELKEERLGTLTLRQLTRTKVLPDAVGTAQDSAMRGDPKQGIRMELVPDDAGKLKPALVDMTTGQWPTNEDGDQVTVDEYFNVFKTNHPFLYQADVAPGSGRSGIDGEHADVAGTTDFDKLMQEYERATKAGDAERIKAIRKRMGTGAPR